MGELGVWWGWRPANDEGIHRDGGSHEGVGQHQEGG